MSYEKKVKRAKRVLGSNSATASDSTFVYQRHGSRVLEEFRRKMDAERERKRAPRVVPIRKDGTEG